MNAAASQDTPLVGIIMGSQSDWATLEHTANMLKQLGVPFEAEVVSAHRTPDRLFEYAEQARDRGIQVIIAGAGGAAHLPGMCAAKTDLPVLGVPVKSSILNGVDSLLIHCANASRYCSGYFGDWSSRCNQCRDYGCTNFRFNTS